MSIATSSSEVCGFLKCRSSVQAVVPSKDSRTSSYRLRRGSRHNMTRSQFTRYHSCPAASCITDVELSSAESHVVENTTDIYIQTEDLSVLCGFSWRSVFSVQSLQIQCFALYTIFWLWLWFITINYSRFTRLDAKKVHFLPTRNSCGCKQWLFRPLQVEFL